MIPPPACVPRAALLPFLCAARLGAQERSTSPRIEELRTQVVAHGDEAVQTFWREVEADGVPLLEPPEDDLLRVTFLWRGTAEMGPVAVFSAATGWTQPKHLLELLPGTNIWHGTFLVPADARFTYRISLRDNLRTYSRDPDWSARSARLRADPFNPDTVSLGGSAMGSIFEGPRGVKSDLIEPPAGPPLHRLVDLTILSGALSENRSVRVYVPSSLRTTSLSRPLLVVLDGDAYTSTAPTPTILDRLSAQGRIPPVVAAFVKQKSRGRELSADTLFTRFLARELVPALQDRFHAGLRPELTTIAGSSLGGLAAAHAALTFPDVIGGVLAQSGSLLVVATGFCGAGMAHPRLRHPPPRPPPLLPRGRPSGEGAGARGTHHARPLPAHARRVVR